MNRWGRNTYSWAYRFLVLRDGEYCAICGPSSKVKSQLEIDHIDGNPLNSHPDNLCILCKTHNCEMRGKKTAEHKCIIERHRLKNESEREVTSASPATHFVKEVVDYHGGSEEMKVNSLSEPKFIEWLVGRLGRDKEVLKSEVIDGGAYHAGCSQVTTTRYLAKMTCEDGPLYEATDAFSRKVIRMKPSKPLTRRSGSSHPGRARSRRTPVDDRDTTARTS